MLESTPVPGLHDKECLIQLLEFNNHPLHSYETSFRKGLLKTLLPRPVRLET